MILTLLRFYFQYQEEAHPNDPSKFSWVFLSVENKHKAAQRETFIKIHFENHLSLSLERSLGV